jgi:hypothetical protein
MLDPEREYLDQELDRQGMERLKAAMSQGKGFQVK